MKGKILGFYQATGEGAISGEDGNRYSFNMSQWRSDRPPLIGRDVDFIAFGTEATEVFLFVGATGGSSGEKNRLVAALLAFFLGSFGFHKFYLGKTKAGLTMLLVFLFGFILLGIPSLVIGVIALVEAIIYLTKSDADFETIYVDGDKNWF